VLFARGLRAITSQEATGIGLLEPILLPLWVFLVWGEEPAVSTLVGGSLILAAVILLTRGEAEKKKALETSLVE
jgi:drug/metabolite transporter (DMT)-like permease